MFQDNKQIEWKQKELQSFQLEPPEKLDTLLEDMINEMEDSWQCKVCGEELQDKVIMGKHVNDHITV